MDLDTTTNILIIGAGPIGLETALYARYLGYPVTVIEQGGVCHHVKQWQHITMFSSFGNNSSPLGRAAILGQSPGHTFDRPESIQTGEQWLNNYLQPLAETDLLSDSIQLNTRVLSISRSWHHKTDLVDGESRQRDPFRILVDDGTTESVLTAHAVIDTSGVLGQPNHIGAGGAMALGEANCRDDFHRISPTTAQAESLRQQKILVIGAGHTAAHTLQSLTAAGNTQITWITRTNDPQPVTPIADDPLVNRRDLVQAVNRLTTRQGVNRLCSPVIDRISRQQDGTFAVELLHAGDPDSITSAGQNRDTTLVVDQIFAHTGFRPDSDIFQELHIHQCYASQGPMKLAAKLMTHSSVDCLDQSETDRSDLINPEPNFYILGIKSYGRYPNFLFRTGLKQIVQLFQIIGGRDSMDLYTTFQ